MSIHKFESTKEAYDACQWDEDIKRGDLLVIESEGVVGVADTWPYAITEAHGELHQLEERTDAGLIKMLLGSDASGWWLGLQEQQL